MFWLAWGCSSNSSPAGNPSARPWRFWAGGIAVLASVVALNRLKAMAVPVTKD